MCARPKNWAINDFFIWLQGSDSTPDILARKFSILLFTIFDLRHKRVKRFVFSICFGVGYFLFISTVSTGSGIFIQFTFLHLRWLHSIFSHSTCNYQGLLAEICQLPVFSFRLNFRSYSSTFPLPNGGFELVSNMIFLLEMKQLTKSASHSGIPTFVFQRYE